LAASGSTRASLIAGAFLACSFWLADNYILQRRFGDARVLFERLLALRNDLGLLAEEYDPRAGRMLGNFPQAFSHVGDFSQQSFQLGKGLFDRVCVRAIGR
jgi:GH15 family glucan-1,4-alpha-glucosidase